MRVVVVGAGLSGLSAARELQQRGHHAVVVDKGRSVGGRLATRRIETPDGRVARVDHGAQFFTVRSSVMRNLVDDWLRDGLVHEWSRGFARGSLDRSDIDGNVTAAPDGFPRYVATGGMTSLAKHLATGLEVQCGVTVTSVRPGADHAWTITVDGRPTMAADGIVLTCPLPQSVTLLAHSGVDLPATLRATEYDRTIALLAVLDGPSAVPAPGGVQQADGVFSWIGDNVSKGVSRVPALTLHASAEWSDEHWDDPPDVQEALLRDAARDWLGTAAIVAAQVKTWRYATPRTCWPEPCWTTSPPLTLAGDAFAGPRVEGAVLSGIAAGSSLG